jgi:hypothetical protein
MFLERKTNRPICCHAGYYYEKSAKSINFGIMGGGEHNRHNRMFWRGA